MRIGPRHLILLNGLTVVACLLHVLVHALNVGVGEWHDYGVYTLVGLSFAASVVHGLQTERKALTA